MYGAPIVLGRVNTYQATNLAIGTTYFFSITAYDNAGNESPHPSAEVSKSILLIVRTKEMARIRRTNPGHLRS